MSVYVDSFEAPVQRSNISSNMFHSRGTPLEITKKHMENCDWVGEKRFESQQYLRIELQHQVMFPANLLCLFSVYIRLN